MKRFILCLLVLLSFCVYAEDDNTDSYIFDKPWPLSDRNYLRIEYPAEITDTSDEVKLILTKGHSTKIAEKTLAIQDLFDLYDFIKLTRDRLIQDVELLEKNNNIEMSVKYSSDLLTYVFDYQYEYDDDVYIFKDYKYLRHCFWILSLDYDAKTLNYTDMLSFSIRLYDFNTFAKKSIFGDICKFYLAYPNIV